MPYLPQPWCSKDPRSTIKAVGIAEILISVIGLIILVTLPIILLQLDHEINYIKQHHHGIQSASQSSFSDPLKQYYILNITENYLYTCDVPVQSMRSYLDRYLNKSRYYEVVLNRSLVITVDGRPTMPLHLCEIHVITKAKPTVIIFTYTNETVDKPYSFRDICVECIQDFTGYEKVDIEDKMNIISPGRDEISKQKIYPVPIGNDPERKACINEEMDGVSTHAVLAAELDMYKLLGCSGVFALISGFVLTSAAFTMSRFALMVTFVMEMISVFLMAGGLVVVNSPLLCLFQYGGISAYSLDTPTHVQTIITYSCAIYCASFKVYLLWNAMAYAEVIPTMKAEQTAKVSPNYSDYVMDVAEEVAKRNQKLAEGGKWSDDDDDEETEYSDDSDQWSDTEEFSAISTSQRSVGSPSKGNFLKPGVQVGPSSSLLLTSDYGGSTSTRLTTSGSSRQQSSRASFAGSGRSGRSGGRIGTKGRIFQPTNTLVAQKRDKMFLDNSMFGH